MSAELFPDLDPTMTPDEREAYIRGVQHGLRASLRVLARLNRDTNAVADELLPQSEGVERFAV